MSKAECQSSEYTLGLTSDQMNYIMRNPLPLEKLPHPDETWKAEDLPDPLRSNICPMTQSSVIRKVTKDDSSGDYKVIWRTDRRSYEVIQDRAAQSDDGFLPCGHGGFTNIGNGKLQCKRDWCGEVFDKSEVAND